MKTGFLRFVLPLALCALLLLTGCAGAKKNGLLEITLEENPTTGYTWSYTLAPGGILAIESDEYIAPGTDLVGAPGRHVWRFAPAADGEVTLTFVSAQAWAGGNKGESRVLRYSVQDGAATLLSDERLAAAPLLPERLVLLQNVYEKDGEVFADLLNLESVWRTETDESGATIDYEEFSEVDGVTHSYPIAPDAYIDFSPDFGPQTEPVAPADFPARFASLSASDGVYYTASIADGVITALTFYYSE